MNESNDIRDFLKNQQKEMGLGATGEFPEGRLDECDEGELKIAVGAKDSNVIINFGKPVAWLALDAKRARSLAELLQKASYNVK
jgi:hypothetical protein